MLEGENTEGAVNTAGNRSFKRKIRDALLHPEVGTIFIFLFSLILSLILSPYFADFRFILDSTSWLVEYGIVALVLTFIVISGEIDLSVTSMMVLVACVAAKTFSLGTPMILAVIIGLACGVLLGAFNGYLVAYIGLPSIIVTIGTLALFRGIAQIIMGDLSIGHFPEWFFGIDMRLVFNIIPVPLIIFIVLSVIAAFVLSFTIFGRKVYAVGTNEQVAVYSGIRSKRLKLLLFSFSGLMSALGGIMMISRLGVARYNLASEGLLDVVTIVLLGGTDINGGKGSILGTFVAFFVLVILRTGMSVANIKIENQLAVLGTLLISSIIISNYLYSKRNR